MSIINKFFMSLAILSIVIPVSFSVSAQEAETPSLAIEEIIVTARKKMSSYKTFQWQLQLLQSN